MSLDLSMEFKKEREKDKPAIITTSLIPYYAQAIRVTADVGEAGSIEVSVLDESGKELTTATAITETVTDARLELSKKLDAKRIQLKFEVNNAKLYSFSFGGRLVSASRSVEQPDSDGFIPIFDGNTLEGWHAAPEESVSDWSVRDVSIVGHGSADRLSYLVWEDADLAKYATGKG